MFPIHFFDFHFFQPLLKRSENYFPQLSFNPTAKLNTGLVPVT